MRVLLYKNLAYLPITKNASSSFTQHFKNMGWIESDLNQLTDSFEIFGHLRDPIDRHYRGTAEFLLQNNIVRLLDDPSWQPVWLHAVMDIHSYPITWATQGKRIHWIPIAPGVNTVELTGKWLRARGVELGTVERVRSNLADSGDAIVRKLYELSKTDKKKQSLNYFYNDDMQLWNKVMPYTDEDNITYHLY